MDGQIDRQPGTRQLIFRAAKQGVPFLTLNVLQFPLMNQNLNLSLRKQIYFQICAWLFSQVQFTEWLTEKPFFTCTSEQFQKLHLLMYLLTLHTRLSCLQDYPDQFGMIMHPSLKGHLQLQRKIRCLIWNTGLNKLNLDKMYNNCYLLQQFLDSQ